MLGTSIPPALLWALLGIGLMVAEVFSGAFVLLFFGAAALVVALVKLTGLTNFPIDMILFGCLGLAGAFTLRKKILHSMRHHAHFKTDESLILSDDVPPKGMASITYQGSLWTAINESDIFLKKGDTVRVVRIEGIKLHLEPLR